MNIKAILIPLGIGAVAGLILGFAAAGGSTPEAAPAVTKTVEAPAATVTVTPEPVTISEVPAICIAAIDEADRVIDITTRMAGYVEQHLLDEGEVWTALSDGDFSSIDSYTTQMDIFTENIAGLTHEVGTLRYAENSAACRTLAGS